MANHQQGLILGPNFWRDFLLPHLKRMYKIVMDQGK